jgi:hypothetical protein
MITKHTLLEAREQLRAAILETLVNEPTLTYPQVADMYAVSRWTVTTIAKANNIHRPTGRKPVVTHA